MPTGGQEAECPPPSWQNNREMLRFSLGRGPVHHGHIIFQRVYPLSALLRLYPCLHICMDRNFPLIYHSTCLRKGFPGGVSGKEPTCKKKNPPARQETQEMWVLIPELGEHGNPFQYSCLENPMDRGAWWTTVHEVAERQTRLKPPGSLFWFPEWSQYAQEHMRAKVVKFHLDFCHRSEGFTL